MRRPKPVEDEPKEVNVSPPLKRVREDLLQTDLQYQSLLKCQEELKRQQQETLKDITQMISLVEFGASNPQKFLEDYKKGNLKIPSRINIEEMPVVDWSRYTLGKDEDKEDVHSDEKAHNKDGHSLTNASSESISPLPDELKFGRSLWSKEELITLDEELTKYPPDSLREDSFENIAQALSTKSALEVKYWVLWRNKEAFKPNISAAYQSHKNSLSGHNFKVNFLSKNNISNSRENKVKTNSKKIVENLPHNDVRDLKEASTISFSPFGNILFDNKKIKQEPLDESENISYKANTVSVKLEEPNNDHEQSFDEMESQEISDDESGSYREESEQLKRLLQVRRWKRREIRTSSVFHHTFSCSGCLKSPIEGTRYHCLDCDDVNDSHTPAQDKSVDFCESCYSMKFKSSKSRRHDSKSHFNFRTYETMHIKQTIMRLASLEKDTTFK